MIYPNEKELENIQSNTTINGLKLILTCSTCGRKWSIWFSGLDDRNNNLPENWHICQNCKNQTDREFITRNGEDRFTKTIFR